MQQLNLFDDSNNRELSLTDFEGCLDFHAGFLSQRRAKAIFEELWLYATWIQDEIKMYDRLLPVPRQNVWYGMHSYSYSGIKLEPQPIPDFLNHLKNDIEVFLGHEFNSVLANLYRNEKDSVSWHSDDERELGECSVIASLSLGETRNFEVKRAEKGARKISIPLASGDLLIMKNDFQRNWLHQIPKEKHECGPRINLTFRKIILH